MREANVRSLRSSLVFVFLYLLGRCFIDVKAALDEAGPVSGWLLFDVIILTSNGNALFQVGRLSGGSEYHRGICSILFLVSLIVAVVMVGVLWWHYFHFGT
jgi:hypothetical protein